MTEVYEKIYKVPIPLPQSPLKELNCFIIKGNPRSLIIDTGFNNDICYEAMMSALDKLDINLDNSDIFLTHLHADHSGLSSRLKTDKNRIFVSKKDGDRVNNFLNPDFWKWLDTLQSNMGFPDEKRLDVKDHPAYKNRISSPISFVEINDGDILSYGGYSFEVIDLEGHTPSQKGLWCKDEKILFCGDHILNKITPNINLWDFETDYLGKYIQNLQRVHDMDVKHLFSAHRKHIENHKERIQQLLEHHQHRLEEIIEICFLSPTNVYDVAKQMKWDFGNGSFSDFPSTQKWFAASEVFAHLEHLRCIGKVTLQIVGNEYIYTSTNHSVLKTK